VANQTLGGAELRERVRAKAQEGDTRFVLVIPQTRPGRGAVIYDEAMRDSAQVRADLARQLTAAEGIELETEIGDEDPFAATMDAIAHHHPDEVLVSTLPRTVSGWLRRDLVGRIREESGLPVEHIVTDIDKEGLPFAVTLVLANQTVGEPALLERLKAKAAETPGEGGDPGRLFIVVVPQDHGLGHAVREARDRLARTLDSLHHVGLLCAGMIGDPDPYKAAMNAMEAFRVDDVVVSTLEPVRSRWLRGHLIERIQDSTGKPVEHVMAGEPEAAPAS
jgi:hypothetical protein